VAVALLTLAACAPAEALGPGHATVTLTIEHSRFTPGRIAVAEGTHVVFRVVNGDPIDHELIVGPAASTSATSTGPRPSTARCRAR
jgi:hypothetical protein